MERDFMGLNSKDSGIVVKEEAAEGCKDSAIFKGLKVQWTLPTAFDPSNKRQSGEIQNFAGAPTKPHFLGGIPITAPHSMLPSTGSLAGTTEPWFNSKTSRAPAQFTIFYGGNVSVFDDISPEKAQAIMFLAGNGSSTASNIGQPRHQVQAPTSKPVTEDVVYVNQCMNTPPCSGLSSPISVSSHPVEAPKMVTSLGHVAATTMIQSAVPQARKASLARFLEKRKERVMNSAPYNLTKKSAECATPGSNGVSFSGSSGLCSASMSTSNDSSHKP